MQRTIESSIQPTTWPAWRAPFTMHTISAHARPEYVTIYPYLGVAEVWVDVVNERVEVCGHDFTSFNRYGHGQCRRCGARGWSPSWVESGAFLFHDPDTNAGINATSDYLIRTLRHYRATVGTH